MKRCVALLAAALACAQPQPDPAVDAKIRSNVIDSVLDQLNRGYVYPGVARNMADAIHQYQRKGDYDRITNPTAFAQALTADLQAVSHDLHLHVDYFYESPVAKPVEPRRSRTAADNFGFEKLEHLPGNIGYLQLSNFDQDDISPEEVAAAMTSLADSRALIIDLRYTGGGRRGMVQLIASYLFGAQPVHLDDLYWRPTDSVEPIWTLTDLPGRRMPDADVYILTSRRSFSGPEAFAYELQALKRATIVGEITGGGAHPVEMRRIDEHFTMLLPAGRVINPVTKTDWEYVGVRPDIAVSAEKALATAHLMALKKIIANTSDPTLKARLEKLIPELEKNSK
jgi:C-terminal processing protease CtpA/Prc